MSILHDEELQIAQKKNDIKNMIKEDNISAVIINIWDCVNLARIQYSQLGKVEVMIDHDLNYNMNQMFNRHLDEKIDLRLNDRSSDINSRLITLVSIFTALAFIVFGSFGGLSAIFKQSYSIFRLIIIGGMWGLGVLNVVFIFMFCASKLAGVELASDKDKEASLFRKYPIFFWSNFFIMGILILAVWFFYLKNKVGLALLDVIIMDSKVASIIGTAVIVAILLILARKLVRASEIKLRDNKKKNH